MGNQNIFKRYEIKYLITQEQRHEIQTRMAAYMEPDLFGKSTICNIYFDTPSKLLVRRSNEKPIYKEKLRVRSYGAATAESKVFIELKKKYDGIVYKRRIGMSQKEAENYLYKRQCPGEPTQIIKEINYFYNLYDDLGPSTYISYERSAYYSKNDCDFRMTFDENILFRNYDLSLKSNSYGEPLLDKSMVLLEVKTALGVPIWLTHVLSGNHIYKTTFSKYGSAYLFLIRSAEKGGTYVA